MKVRMVRGETHETEVEGGDEREGREARGRRRGETERESVFFGRYIFSYVVTKVNGKKSRQLLAH